MKQMNIVALFCVLCLSFHADVLVAQEQQPDADVEGQEEILTPDDYNIKAYKVSFGGGPFSGCTFFSPRTEPLGDNTYLALGANNVIGFDGEIMEIDPDIHDAPVKEIIPGNHYMGKIAMYINDSFHFDLIGSYSNGSAIVTFLNLNEDDPEHPYREELDRDDGFKSFKGGFHMMYDLEVFRFLGIEPFLGFGLGGIINRFSTLEDKTGLYFSGDMGLSLDITDRLAIFSQVSTTTFNFFTEELSYGKTLTYFHGAIGLSWFFDTIPQSVKDAVILDD